MILEKLALNRSQIFMGTNCFAEALKTLAHHEFSGHFLISQKKIWDLHGARLGAALADCDVQPKIRMIDDGESTKNLTVFADLLTWLAEQGADRRGLVVVLGGGVVGDLCGFVAASYMRGMQWLYIPTTLLAQQDASVGGKVGVNLPIGKNLVGAFWDPLMVIIDSAVLATLPLREVNAGYMELLKHGMLQSPELYRRIAALPLQPDWSLHLPLLAEGLKVKVGIVSEDPFEKGRRRLLNLGHTLGHALESFTAYRTLLHGEAVGLGLVYATMVAARSGSGCDWSALYRAVRLRLPAFDARGWERGRILDLTQHDKKGVKGKVAWGLPRAPGQVDIVADIPRATLAAAFDEFHAWLAC